MINQSIEHKPTNRVLDILEVISNTPYLTQSDISSRLSIPKGTLSPIIRTLIDRDYIKIDPKTGGYVIYFQAYILGCGYINDIEVQHIIRDEMKKMVDKIGETCQFGILLDGDIFYLIKEDPSEAIRIISHEGKRIPAYCTAIGKSLLQDFSLDELKKLYTTPLHAFTDKTITDIERLYLDVQQAKNMGLTTENEESSNDLCCYSVPLRVKNKIVAALSVSVPKYRLTMKKSEIIEETLHSYQAKIEDILLKFNIYSSEMLL